MFSLLLSLPPKVQILSAAEPTVLQLLAWTKQESADARQGVLQQAGQNLRCRLPWIDMDSKIDQWMKGRLETNIQLSFFVFQFKPQIPRRSVTKNRKLTSISVLRLNCPKRLSPSKNLQSMSMLHASSSRLLRSMTVRSHHHNASPPCPKYTHRHAK